MARVRQALCPNAAAQIKYNDDDDNNKINNNNNNKQRNMNSILS